MRKDVQRNARTEPDAEAGWAAVAVAVSGGTKVGDFEGKHERVTEAAAGRVNLELGSPAYRGATTQSNNTGELTALLRAVELEMRRPHVAVEFCVDSLYAHLGTPPGDGNPPGGATSSSHTGYGRASGSSRRCAVGRGTSRSAMCARTRGRRATKRPTSSQRW